MSGQKTINNTTPSIGAIKIQQSTYGLVLPIVWGMTRITGNLIWYGDFKSTPHTEVTQSGGKGGGGAPRQTTTSYTYSAAVAMALCRGPIVTVRTAWRGKKIYGGTAYSGVLQLAIQNTPYTGATITVGNTAGWTDVSVERLVAAAEQDDYTYRRANTYQTLVRGVDYTAAAGVYTFTAGALVNGEMVRISYTFTAAGSSGSSCLGQIGLDLYNGSPGQAPWSYLTTKYPSQALGYSSIAYVAAPTYSLDDGAAVENHAFEVQSILMFSATNYDANPAPVVLDAMTNPLYGAGFGAEKIGDLTDYTAACTAQGIFMSPALTAQMTAAEFLQRMAALTNVGLVWSNNVLKFIPYTDVALTGNGVTFTPNTAPIYDLTDDDFQNLDEPVKVNRGSPMDSFNQVTVQFSDRANAYNVGVMVAQDQADIQENGLRAMQTIQADWITEASVAKIVAQLILQRSMFVRNTYEFLLNGTKIGLEPMDLVTLTDPVLMTRLPVRILSMEEDDSGYLAFVAEDFPKGSASATLYPSASGTGFAHDQNESPGTLGAPVIFEAPAALTGQAGGLELWLAAGNSGATYGGCEIWVSLTGSNYQRATVIHGASRFGVTTSALAATAGTTTETVGVSLTAGGQLLAGTTADMNALSTLCYVGGEFIGYETATLTGGSAYTLGNHMLRGAYLSAAAAHASGSAFVRCDEAIARMPLSPDYIGKTLHIKVLPFNRYGGGMGDLASATDYTYTVTGVQANNAPVAPGGLALEGAFTIDTAKFKWNAVSNAATYNVQMFNGATKVREVNVGNALRFDYSSADAKVDGGPWRSLTAKVQGINANGAVGPLASLGVSNPQVGALAGVAFAAAVGGAQFSCTLPSDQDFLGIQICMSTTSGFTPGAGNVVYDGPSTTTAITGLASGTPVYFRAAGYDTFDKLGMTFSAEFAVTPTSASIANNSITQAMLQAGIIDLTKFASGIEPVTMVTSVPSVKSTYSVFNTTDGKLYRWNGTAYVATVAAADLSGTLADAQLAAIAASKITGQLSDTQLAAIAAAKITGTLTSSQIADLAASKITGTLADAQIAALAASKVTGTLTNVQIADLAATKLTGQITTTQITDGGISTAKLAANAVTAGKIAADTITANEIAAGAITASELATGSVIAGKIAAGTIQAGDIAAGAITTSKLLVTSQGQALNDDPACEDPSAWVYPSPITTGTAAGNGAVGLNYFTAPYNGTSPVLISKRSHTVDPARTYSLTANIIGAATNDRFVYLLVEFLDAAGVHISTAWGAAYSGYIYYGVPNSGAWQRVGGSFGVGTPYPIPSTACTMKVGVIFQYAGSGSSNALQAAQDIRLERVNDGSLIVDGAIVASKLAAGSVVAGKIAAGTIVAADIAADTITAAQIAASAVTATELAAGAVIAGKIAAGTIQAADIAADTITAAQIAANAITASELSADSVIAGKIAASAISAREIQAGAITAGKLAVGDFTNLVSNPSGYLNALSTSDGWSGPTAGKAAGVFSATSEPYLFFTTRDNYNGTWFRVTPGEQFYVEFTAQPNGGTGDVDIGLGLTTRGLDPASSTGQAWPIGVTRAAGSGGVTNTYSGIVTIGAGAYWAQSYILVSTSTSSAGFYLKNIKVIRMAGSTLIQDGAITTNKILAGAVTADRITVSNLAAINAELGSAVISATGSLRSGQTAFDTGTGWWWGFAGGVPKASIGVAGGAGMKWDGSALTIKDPVIVKTTAFAVTSSPSSDAKAYTHSTSEQYFGRYTASSTGGTGAVTYNFALDLGNASVQGMTARIVVISNTQVDVYGKCNLVTNCDIYVRIGAVDASGASAVQKSLNINVDWT